MTINQCSVFIVTGSYTHIIWEMFVMIYYTACRAKKQQKNPLEYGSIQHVVDIVHVAQYYN